MLVLEVLNDTTLERMEMRYPTMVPSHISVRGVDESGQERDLTQLHFHGQCNPAYARIVVRVVSLPTSQPHTPKTSPEK